jgi:glycosyltransferase involved in cell wall biosynthesis
MRTATEEAPWAAQQLDISIVMPCLNEEGSVGACVREALDGIAKAGLAGEVIVVDNNSTDGSAAEAAEAGAKVVHEARPGYGSALLRGFAEARGKYMMMGDCDGTYYFGDLQPFIEPLENGYEMVVGNRLSDQLAPGAMPWAHRVIGTPMISWVLRLFTGAKIRDSQCGIRAMRRDSIQALGLRSSGMEFASEMILKAARRGLRVAEVPVPYDVRTGEAKLRTIQDGWRHLRFLLVSSPSYVFLAPGLLCLLLGSISLAITLFANSGVNILGVDWEPVFAASIFFVIGINALMLGVLSKIIGVRVGDVESRVVRLYHRYLGLERLLALALIMLVVGIGLNAFVLIEALSDSDRDLLPWTAAAQALIVMAANLVFGGIAIAMVDYETAAP